jgi:hypothetical protein
MDYQFLLKKDFAQARFRSFTLYSWNDRDIIPKQREVVKQEEFSFYPKLCSETFFFYIGDVLLNLLSVVSEWRQRAFWHVKA